MCFWVSHPVCALQYRLIDSVWTVMFKALIVIHLMIREGARDSTLQYLAEHPKTIALIGCAEGESMPRQGLCRG